MKTLYLYIFFLICLTSCNNKVTNPEHINTTPSIYPDYSSVTIPFNIAPLNFTIKTDTFDLIDVVINDKSGNSIHIQNEEVIQIPDKAWKKMLSSNKGQSICVTVSLRANGHWKQYNSFPIYISPYPIDGQLVYRLIAPGYEVYSKMGIYQRDLSSFEQTALIENTLIPGTCVNCHAFNQNNPKSMSLHIRGAQAGTMILKDGKMKIYNTKTDSTISPCVYPYWHPSNRYIAYSVNQTKQAFHEVCHERVEVFDAASDIVVFDIIKNKLISCKALRTVDLETFPAFSPDGKTLYFCTAKKRDIQTDYKNIRYSLCKIDFDASTGSFGEKVDTLISSVQTGKSISFPRPSFDGKYIMFTLSNYGNFSIWHKEADLYLFDIKNKTFRALTNVNSNNTESYHNWSRNSHWFVFSSRRGDGLYTRPYFSSINARGEATKPFLLPQKDPRMYNTSLKSFNIPEFVTAKVYIDLNTFETNALSPVKSQPEFCSRK